MLINGAGGTRRYLDVISALLRLGLCPDCRELALPLGLILQRKTNRSVISKTSANYDTGERWEVDGHIAVYAVAVRYACRLAIAWSTVRISPVAAVYQRQLSVSSPRGRLMSSKCTGYGVKGLEA